MGACNRVEVAPGVHRITVGEAAVPGLYPPNSYLVAGSRAAAFIDTGYDRQEHVQARLDCWRGLGEPPVAAIILTHRHSDHMGGAAGLHQASGAPIVTHPAEREVVEGQMGGKARVGRVAADGEVLDLGGLTLELVHSPGHTLGSLCVFLRESAALFTGDTVLGASTSVIRPGEGDLVLYLQSLERLLGYGPATIYPGHGPVVRSAQAKLRSLLQHRREREEQVLAHLRAGRRTLEELLEAIYPELTPHLRGMARDQLRSHLAKLESEGRARPVGETFWSLA